MLILALDTSTQAGSLAVLRDARILGEVSTWVDETYSSRMFRHLEFLFKELSFGLPEIDLYAVAAGPGSFTGLRVGLTAVKGWAEVYSKPIAAVSALEAVAAQAHASETLLAPEIDARRGQIYAGLYERRERSLVRRGEEMVMTPEEVLGVLKERASGTPVAFVSPTPEVLQDAVKNSVFRNSVMEQVSTVLAPIIGQVGYERARRGELVDALTLDANYIRRSDAELLWEGP